MADAADSKSAAHKACGFKSHLGHQFQGIVFDMLKDTDTRDGNSRQTRDRT